MQHLRNEARSETTLHKPKASFSWFTTVSKKKLFVCCLAVSLLVLLLVLWIIFSGTKSHRTELYKDVTGSAGLNATIAYDCPSPCEQKFDFNVYLFNDNGQQVNVLRPNQEGKVFAALPEGNYVMLIGKQFGKDKLFPQEPIMLKNEKELELKLHYKEGRL